MGRSKAARNNKETVLSVEGRQLVNMDATWEATIGICVRLDDREAKCICVKPRGLAVVHPTLREPHVM